MLQELVKITVLFHKPQVQWPNPHDSSQLSVTAGAEDPMPSSDVCRYQASKWCTDIPVDKIPLHINVAQIIKTQRQILGFKQKDQRSKATNH